MNEHGVMMPHVLHVVGARPNFMKVAPVMRALSAFDGIRQTLVHTGQHYDDAMSRVFFEELGLPVPDRNLEVGSGSHAVQTAHIMMRLEACLLEDPPHLVLVYGDVNSTVASALVCTKLGIPVGHVEAGLRSFDRTMPEEINRLLTDQIADLLFTPSEDGDVNLLREGIPRGRIHRVGNVMIDTLVALLPLAKRRWPVADGVGLATQGRTPCPPYALVTLHRPSNVDAEATLAPIMAALADIGRSIPVVFPVHPRTRNALRGMAGGTGEVVVSSRSDLWRRVRSGALAPGVRLLEPLGYLDFLALQMHAAVVITDSGGIQEETTFLGIPCLTLRENTERPITVSMGTNTLIGRDMQALRREVARILAGEGKRGEVPPLWDGHAGERIAAIVARWARGGDPSGG